MRKRLLVENINELPQKPGIYFLKNKAGEIFYIGKANNLRARVRTHASGKSHYPALETIHSVEWLETANEIEALIREREYIQHYKPKVNVDFRDGKQYLYVGITVEELPRIFTTHQPVAQQVGKNRNLTPKTYNLKPTEYIGPFTDAAAVKSTLRYLRHAFPYYTANPRHPASAKQHSLLPCAYCHLGLCPGPNPNKAQYRKTVRAIKQIFTGKKDELMRRLKREMRGDVKAEQFEEAAQKRDRIEALESIFSHHSVARRWKHTKTAPSGEAGAYLAKLLKLDLPVQSIEGYDISNIQGKEPTASMVRFDHGIPNKSLYRHFNIQAPDEPNDFLMMREVVRRRFGHAEWAYPDLILIDGGKGQLNAARTALLETGVRVPIVSLAKRLEELYIPGRAAPVLLSTMPAEANNLLRHVRDEAHRFAITHHRGRHRKTFKR
ncbi:MAG: GIY-YIG nuclease family protein [Candidatus Spechtbacterales bacterium]